MGIHRTLLITFALPTLTLLASCGPGTAAAKEESVLEVKNGTARVVGAVVTNDRGCEVDAICRLILDVGGRQVTVIYHGGEAVRCLNHEAIRQGFAIEPGNRVEAYGAYEESGPIISTCPSESYYLRLLA